MTLPVGRAVGEPPMGSMLTATPVAPCTRGSVCDTLSIVSPSTLCTRPSECGLPSFSAQSSRLWRLLSIVPHGFTTRTRIIPDSCISTTARGSASEAVSTATNIGSRAGPTEIHTTKASSTLASPPETSARPRQKESDARRETREEAGETRESIEWHTRAGGSIGAMRSAHCVRSAFPRSTTAPRCGSARVSASKRWRARPRSVPSTYSAASACAASEERRRIQRPLARRGLGAHEAILQFHESAAHVGLHGTERAAPVIGQFGMRQAVEERERDRLALLGVELAQAALQAMGFGALLGLARRRSTLVGQVRGELLVDVGLLARAPDDVEAAVAHDGRHPRHRRALRPGVVRRVVPDVDETVLQRFLREGPLTDYT